MYDFIKKNIYLIFLFIITLSIGFLTFLTFIDKSFINLSDQNLKFLLILNIVLLSFLFVFIFLEIKKAIKNDIDKDGFKSNKKYITYFALFTFIPSLLISIFSLFLFSFALEKYFDKKVTTVVNNSYELAKNYVDEVRNKVQSEIVLVAFDVNKSKKFLNDNVKEYKRFLKTQKMIRGVDEIHIIDINKKLLFSTLEDNNLGGTMRLGSYEAKLKDNSLIRKIYKSKSIQERHRHRYEVNIAFKEQFEKKGMIFSGLSPDNKLPEIIELKNHPWFIGVQFHPEFKSRPLAPHPLFSSFIKAAKNHK